MTKDTVPEWEAPTKEKFLEQLDFLSDHWVNGDDKRPFSFGGWREEVACSFIEITRALLREQEGTLCKCDRCAQIKPIGRDVGPIPNSRGARKYMCVDCSKETYDVRSQIVKEMREGMPKEILPDGDPYGGIRYGHNKLRSEVLAILSQIEQGGLSDNQK